MKEKFLFKVKTSTVQNEYEINLPTVGQYRDIEVYKQMLSNGMYASLVTSATNSAMNALDIIDIEATLRVLCPKFMEDLKCEIRDLGLKDFAVIKEAFNRDVKPLADEIEKLMKI
jgi:hypothetical protein